MFIGSEMCLRYTVIVCITPPPQETCSPVGTCSNCEMYPWSKPGHGAVCRLLPYSTWFLLIPALVPHGYLTPQVILRSGRVICWTALRRFEASVVSPLGLGGEILHGCQTLEGSVFWILVSSLTFAYCESSTCLIIVVSLKRRLGN